MEDYGFNGSNSRKQRSSSFGSKQSEMCGKQNHLSTGKSFIKVFSRNFSKQLQLPEEFVVNFDGNVPHRFIIESATTKKCCRVEVKEDEDGKVYLEEGWNDFVVQHSLEVGSFLVFEYEEQSILQVKIYGKNGCEKTTFGGTELGLYKPEKTIEIEEIEERDSDDHEEKCRRKTRRLSPYKHGNHKMYGVGRTYAKATEVLISKNSVGFSTVLHKRKIHQFVRLAIPKAVADAKKLSSKEELILQFADGKCWPVNLLHRRNRCMSSYLYKGWKKFLQDNKIVGGDKLSFEFITDDLIRVHVTRNSQVEHQSGDEASGLLNMDCEDEPTTHTTDDMAVEASATGKRSLSEFKSSSFSFTWRETTTGAYLHVPKAVVEDQNLKSKDRVVLRDPEGKCWPLDVRIWYDGRVALTKGWRDFWKGHDITPGDSLYFDFVSESLIQVTIHRGKLSFEPTIEEAPHNLKAMDNRQTTIKGVPNNPEAVDNGRKAPQTEAVIAMVTQKLGAV